MRRRPSRRPRRRSKPFSPRPTLCPALDQGDHRDLDRRATLAPAAAHLDDPSATATDRREEPHRGCGGRVPLLCKSDSERPRCPSHGRCRVGGRLTGPLGLAVSGTGLPPAPLRTVREVLPHTAHRHRSPPRMRRAIRPPFPGIAGFRQGIASRRPRRRGRGGSPQFPGRPFARSTPIRRRVPRRPLPDPGRLPWPSPCMDRLGSLLTRPRAGPLDDAYTGFATRCRPRAHPPRFAPGLSTAHGGIATGDPGVSPDRTHTGWPPRAYCSATS